MVTKKSQIVLIVMTLAALLIFVRTFRSLFVMQEDIEKNWLELESQLESRNDVVRDLVNLIRLDISNEKKVFDDIDSLRLQWSNVKILNEKLGIANALNIELSKLFAAVEKSPRLNTKGSFIKLMNVLKVIESNIAAAGERYNESARGYNIRVKRVPGNIVAGLFGYRVAIEYNSGRK